MSFYIGKDNYNDLILNRENLAVALALKDGPGFNESTFNQDLENGNLRPILESLWRPQNGIQKLLKVAWLQTVNDRVRNPILLLEQAIAQIEIFRDQKASQEAQHLFFSAVQIFWREEALDPHNKNFSKIISIYQKILEQKTEEQGIDLKIDFQSKQAHYAMQQEALLAQEAFAADKKRLGFSEATLKNLDALELPQSLLDAQSLFEDAITAVTDLSITDQNIRSIQESFKNEVIAQLSDVDDPLLKNSQINAIKESAAIAIAKATAIIITNENNNAKILFNLLQDVRSEADTLLLLHKAA